MQNSGGKGVIVLGGHVQAYGIMRVFGELGIDAVIIDSKEYNISRHSKYCKEFYLVSYRSEERGVGKECRSR